MAKKNAAPAQAATTKTVTKSIKRTKRNAMERKCLPKAMKILYAGSDRATFRSLLTAWQESRKKAPVSVAGE